MRDVIFLGDKHVGARCLELLLENADDWNVRVVGVVPGRSNNPFQQGPRTVTEIAASKGIEIIESLPLAEPPDHLVSVQYHAVLKPEELAVRPGGSAMNLHLAPLPEYRGASQFTFAILNEEDEFGVTLHQMVPKVDAGPVYAQRRFAIEPDWTVWDLWQAATQEAIDLFRDEAGRVFAGEIDPVPQESLAPDRPRYFYKKSDVKDLKEIDLSWPIQKIDRYVRALDMPGFEPPYVRGATRRLYLTTRWNQSD